MQGREKNIQLHVSPSTIWVSKQWSYEKMYIYVVVLSIKISVFFIWYSLTHTFIWTMRLNPQLLSYYCKYKCYPNTQFAVHIFSPEFCLQVLISGCKQSQQPSLIRKVTLYLLKETQMNISICNRPKTTSEWSNATRALWKLCPITDQLLCVCVCVFVCLLLLKSVCTC